MSNADLRAVAAVSASQRLNTILARRKLKNAAKYTDIEHLRNFIMAGDVQLVKASHFLVLAGQAGGRFARRQDLPTSACADASTIDAWVAEIRATNVLRHEFPNEDELQHGMRFPPLVIVSYAWLSPEHPDPEGRQLREVLAPAIEWYMSERATYISGDVYAVKHSAAGKRAQLTPPFTAEGIDFGIFLDFSSIWQKERSPVQEQSFHRALDSMDLLYAHQETVVWRMTRLLSGDTVLPYEQRGWPFFETAASQYVKPAWHCLDLGSTEATQELANYEGVTKVPSELAEQKTYWHHSGTPGRVGKLKDRRLPPLVPEEFAKRATSKTVTNGKDKEVLLRLQADVSTCVLSTVRVLSFSALGWGDSDATLLAKALRLCANLHTLNLSRNEIGPEGARDIAASTAVMASLTEVDLRQNNFGTEGWCSIFDALAKSTTSKITKWELYTSGVGGEHIGPQGAKSLAAYLAVSTSLTKIDVRSIALGDDGKAALRKAVEGRSASGFELVL